MARSLLITFKPEFQKSKDCFYLRDCLHQVIAIEFVETPDYPWESYEELDFRVADNQHVVTPWELVEAWDGEFLGEYKHLSPTVIKSPKGKVKRKKVYYAVSYTYNGGIIVGGKFDKGLITGGKWYQGFSVPSPIVPVGWKLQHIGISPELNCKPPMQIALLVRE